LRRRGARNQRQHGSRGRQMHKGSARKLHEVASEIGPQWGYIAKRGMWKGQGATRSRFTPRRPGAWSREIADFSDKIMLQNQRDASTMLFRLTASCSRAWSRKVADFSDKIMLRNQWEHDAILFNGIVLW